MDPPIPILSPLFSILPNQAVRRAVCEITSTFLGIVMTVGQKQRGRGAQTVAGCPHGRNVLPDKQWPLMLQRILTAMAAKVWKSRESGVTKSGETRQRCGLAC